MMTPEKIPHISRRRFLTQLGGATVPLPRPMTEGSLPPTPVSTLEAARETAMAAGLQFVYLGNVHPHPTDTGGRNVNKTDL